MSVTIDSLDIQIRSSAGSAAKNIDDLAKALGNLNANAKVTKIVNSLNNLNTALTNMKSQQAVMSHLSALSKSLSNLAVIPKLTGLQSAIKELKKLPEVMNGLDTAGISQFTDKMKLLASGLGPLATQIDKIGKGFSKLPPQVSKCVTAVKRLDSANKSVAKSTRAHSDALSGQSFNLFTAYENLENVFSMMHGIQDAIAKVLNDAIQWDSVQARFGRAMGDSAEKYLAYAQKVNEEMGINQQQFMGYSSLFADMMRGFGVGQGDAATMAVGFTELAYDIWAGTGDVFQTLEEAMDAVRSTIGGETESIQRAGFSVIESTLKETAARHGLAVNIEKATMAEKTYLRYLTLVDQAHARSYVGVYAAEMKTAEGAIRSLTQSVKTLSQAFGGLFIPVLELVIPYLTAFVELVTDGVREIAALFGIELFKIDWRSTSSGIDGLGEGATNAATGLNSAANAAKKLKHYTMGFDELNVIDPNSGSGSGSDTGGATGGSGNWYEGIDLDTLWDESVFAKASEQVDELKTKIKDFFNEWRLEIEAFGAGTMLMTLGKIVDKLKEAELFSGGFFKNMNTVSKLGLSTVVITLQWALMDEALENFIEEGSWGEYIKAVVASAVGTWVLWKQWGPTGLVIGLGITAVVSLKSTFEDGSVDSIEEVTTGLTGIAAAAGSAWVVLKKLPKDKGWIGALVNGLGLLLKGKVSLGGFLSGLFPSLTNIATTATTWVTSTLLPGIKAALVKLPSLLVNVVKAIPGWGWVAAAILAVLAAAIKLAVTDYDFTDIGYKIGHALGTALKKVGELLGKLGEWKAKIRESILKGINAAWEWIKEEFDINNVFELIYMMFHPKTWLNKIIPKMIEIGSEVLPGLWQGIKDGWDNFWGNIAEFLDGFVQGFKDGLGIHSPSTVFAEIGDNIVAGLIGGISQKWEDLKKWFRENVEPKLTVEYWTNKFGVIKDAVSSNLDEVKKTFLEKWESIKTWFKLHVAPKFTWGFWLNKFSGIKDGFTQTIKNAVNAGINLMNKFIGWINSHLNFSWDSFEIAGKEIVPAGSIQLFTIPMIPKLEKGGFLEDGLFTMNHGEIAGKFNNGKSVVANNQQIVEGIAAGVYEAVVAAMNETNGRGEQSVNVYLDGKQIATAVEKRQSERGRTLMGSQLGYVY